VAPAGLPPRLYVPPFPPFTNGEWPDELWVTEGEKKSVAATVAGIPTLGLSGVWSWRSRGGDDHVAVRPDVRAVPWRGRSVLLVYDSDITPDHKARPAFHRLGQVLLGLGAATVRIATVEDRRAA
jgi:hypothetical protein